LEILAFPCNQFGGQEPGSLEEIQNTVCTRFKAEFPIFDKVKTLLIILFYADRRNALIMPPALSIPTFSVAHIMFVRLTCALA
jgi:hypothetical protein